MSIDDLKELKYGRRRNVGNTSDDPTNYNPPLDYSVSPAEALGVEIEVFDSNLV
jgi:hypothetical protein